MLQVESISMAPKSQGVSELHQNMINKNHANQEVIQGNFAHEIKHNSQQTVKSTKSENNEFRYDAKNKGNGNSENGHGKQKKEEEKEKEHEIKLSSFDIKI